jgi:hypothetical protein
VVLTGVVLNEKSVIIISCTMRNLQFVFAVLVFMTSSVLAADNLLALGRNSFGSSRTGVGTTASGIPVLQFVVDETTPHGVIPIEARVSYLASVWGRSEKLRIAINTTFVVYDERKDAEALQRSPHGARAVAHAPTREVVADHGRAMQFLDQGTFKLDRYLSQGRYAVYAYIDLSGEGTLSEVLPKLSASAGTPSGVLKQNGAVELSGTAIQLDFASLLPRMAIKLEPQLAVTNVDGAIRVSWPSQFPDYRLEASEVGSSTWTPISSPGLKEVMITETRYDGSNRYQFQSVIPPEGAGQLFRLVPGGLTEHTGAGLPSPVTRR